MIVRNLRTEAAVPEYNPREVFFLQNAPSNIYQFRSLVPVDLLKPCKHNGTCLRREGAGQEGKHAVAWTHLKCMRDSNAGLQLVNKMFINDPHPKEKPSASDVCGAAAQKVQTIMHSFNHTVADVSRCNCSFET